ncbi:MAG: hypothetical protein M1829_004887 [Trizodia sp. TS-e1964]|nr:MAG: hypothetical protein M1829_004887 [Trizodia sp. TS-e1964]
MRRAFRTRPPIPKPVSNTTSPPLIEISKSTFYRQPPSSSNNPEPNPPLFPELNFTVPSFIDQHNQWAIIGPPSAGKTTFLEILGGQHYCDPPTSRTFPYLTRSETEKAPPHSNSPSTAFQYVEFSGGNATKDGGNNLGAIHESLKGFHNHSLLDYLRDKTLLNSLEQDKPKDNDEFFAKVIKDCRLRDLLDTRTKNLSKGQTRRAIIAKALLRRPKLLLIDEPFDGLEYSAIAKVYALLARVSYSQSPRLVLSLSWRAKIPTWITHVLCLWPNCQLGYRGSRANTKHRLNKNSDWNPKHQLAHAERAKTLAKILAKPKSIDLTKPKNKNHPLENDDTPAKEQQEPLVEILGVKLKYAEKTVLGSSRQTINGERKEGLWWNVMPGERWGLFGPKGSGKTTLLSLITSDHPQAYSLPIRIFGHSRLPIVGQPGLSIFSLQSRIGHLSPEIHAAFPTHLTVRRAIETSWADTPLSRPELNHERDLIVDSSLRWFKPEIYPAPDILNSNISSNFSIFSDKKELSPQSGKPLIDRIMSADLDWADNIQFRDLHFQAQRVVLFLRAILKKPELIILDEAFHGLDEKVQEKCMLFLEAGERIILRYTTKKGKPAKNRQASNVAKLGRVQVAGLEPYQALIVVSDVKKEIPQYVTKWLRLPGMGARESLKFGTFGTKRESAFRAIGGF